MRYFSLIALSRIFFAEVFIARGLSFREQIPLPDSNDLASTLHRSREPKRYAIKPAPDATPKLTAEQRAQLPALLSQGAEAFGFRGQVWTTQRVAWLILQQFGIMYHRAHCSRLLRGIKYSQQKAHPEGTQRDESAIENWKEQRQEKVIFMNPNRALSYARALRGWSQHVVANKIGTSPKNVSRWECGETFPSPYYRELLCQVFELDVKALGLLPLSGDDETTDTSAEPLSPAVSSPQFDDAHLFIGHEALLYELLRQLHPGRSLALAGLPGVGKTAVLRKLLHSPQIRERFSDGVIWVELGPTPDIPRHLARVARLLGFSLEQEDSEAERLHLLSQFLHEVFPRRHLLVVLDDVWTTETALPFLLESSSVTYVLTTRLPKVAFALTSQQPYIIPPLPFEASLHLLTTLVPAVEAMERPLQQEIIAFTGGLPLALTFIGKYLASHSYGGQVRRLEMALNQLRDPAYRLQLSFPSLHMNASPTQNDSNVHSLDTTIALSTQRLPEDAQIALQALSILPRAPEYFSEEAALAITATGQEVLDLLVDVGLIEPIQNNRYRIHQIIADYGCYHLKEKAPQMRLIKYMDNVCIKHKTNVALLEREYSTLRIGLTTACVLRMQTEMMQGVFALLPLMQIHGETAQAEHYLRQALHAIFEVDPFLYTAGRPL